MTRGTGTCTIAACFLAVGLLVAARADPAAQRGTDPRLAPVLSRAAAYVDGFARQFLYRETADPTLPLLFLDGRNQPRFAFRLDGEETIEGQRAWRIRYTEQAVPTIIQYEGFDVPASGTLWIEEQAGRLLKGAVKALLRKGRMLTRLEIEVIFKRSDALGLWVPAELRERFEWPTGELVGVATYTNFRRFDTSGRIVVPR